MLCLRLQDGHACWGDTIHWPQVEFISREPLSGPTLARTFHDQGRGPEHLGQEQVRSKSSRSMSSKTIIREIAKGRTGPEAQEKRQLTTYLAGGLLLIIKKASVE